MTKEIARNGSAVRNSFLRNGPQRYEMQVRITTPKVEKNGEGAGVWIFADERWMFGLNTEYLTPTGHPTTCFTNLFQVPFSQLYFSVLGSACQKYLLISTAKLGCI